jgi:hypothetical protein
MRFNLRSTENAASSLRSAARSGTTIAAATFVSLSLAVSGCARGTGPPALPSISKLPRSVQAADTFSAVADNVYVNFCGSDTSVSIKFSSKPQGETDLADAVVTVYSSGSVVSKETVKGLEMSKTSGPLNGTVSATPTPDKLYGYPISYTVRGTVSFSGKEYSIENALVYPNWHWAVTCTQ